MSTNTTARICAVALGLVLGGSTALAQSLKIEEKTDKLTQETMVIGGPLKVCKAEGIKCASLILVWMPTAPETITVNVKVPEQMSVQRLQLRMDGEVRSFDSVQAITDTHIDYNSLFGITSSSANTFVLPVGALRALTENEPSLLRVSGVNDSVDFDFKKRAKMRGLPVDELRQFLTAIAEKTQR